MTPTVRGKARGRSRASNDPTLPSLALNCLGVERLHMIGFGRTKTIASTIVARPRALHSGIR